MKHWIFILLLIVLWPLQSEAVVTIEGTGSGGGYGVTTISFSVNCGSNPDRIILAGIGINNETTALSSVTYNSVGLSLILRQGVTSHANAAEMWYLTNPASGSHTLEFTLDTADYAGAWGICVSGAASLGTAASAEENTGSPGTLSVDVTGVSNGMIIDLFVHTASGAGLCAQGTGQTLQVTIDDTADGGCSSPDVCTMASSSTETGTVTMDWDCAPVGGYLSIIAVPISPAVPAAGVARRRPIVIQ